MKKIYRNLQHLQKYTRDKGRDNNNRLNEIWSLTFRTTLCLSCGFCWFCGKVSANKKCVSTMPTTKLYRMAPTCSQHDTKILSKSIQNLCKKQCRKKENRKLKSRPIELETIFNHFLIQLKKTNRGHQKKIFGGKRR